MKDILKVYKYLDKLNIYNSDIKSESFVFKYKLDSNSNINNDNSGIDIDYYIKSNNQIMLKNFQASIIINDYNKVYTLNDTTAMYSSPEFAKVMINKKSKWPYKYKGNQFKSNDIYGIGLVCYAILYGKSPYYNSINFTYQNQWLNASVNGGWIFDDKHFKGFKVNLSDYGKDFINKLLENDYKKRIDINQAINHQWLK